MKKEDIINLGIELEGSFKLFAELVQNNYEILGVRDNATKNEIRLAFRKLEGLFKFLQIRLELDFNKCSKCGSVDLMFIPQQELKIKFCNKCGYEELLN